jgi:pimeloyl-ACP methyl ester carboxylesterase
MGMKFYGLVDEMLSEVHRREPDYLSRFPIGIPEDLSEIAERYARHPFLATHPAAAIEQVIADGLAHVARSSPTATRAAAGEDDPLTGWLCDGIVDAFRADQGDVALEPCPPPEKPVAEIFADGYSERRTPAGARYFLRKGGGRPLLVISATGTPPEIWRRFLADTSHGFRIIVPERQGGDLFTGGLQRHVDLSTETEALAPILDAEAIERADLLAWCNGARLAIDLAGRRPDRISAVVLLTPMLKGIRGVEPNPSPFERDLQPLLDAAARQAAIAPFLAKTIAQQAQSPDWSRLKDAAARMETLFGRPAKDIAANLLTPMAEGESLINVARRVASDEAYPIHEILPALKTPMLVIMGTNDQVVSNAHTSAVMRMTAGRVTTAFLTGGGHYIQDLQYPYFRLLLTEYLERDRPPPGMARLLVEGGDANRPA